MTPPATPASSPDVIAIFVCIVSTGIVSTKTFFEQVGGIACIKATPRSRRGLP